MTIESSPAEMMPATGEKMDTIPAPAKMTRGKSLRRSSPKGKTPKSSKRSKKPTGNTSAKSTRKTGKKTRAKPTKKPSKIQGVRTRTRSGKTITRAKAGQKGVLAKKGLHLLVVRVPPALHAKVWARVAAAKKKDKSASANALLVSLLSRALR